MYMGGGGVYVDCTLQLLHDVRMPALLQSAAGDDCIICYNIGTLTQYYAGFSNPFNGRRRPSSC